LPVLALAVAGCGGGEDGDAPAVVQRPIYEPPTQVDPWVLATDDPDFPTPALLWNGLVGMRIDRNGTSLTQGGERHYLYAIDGYQVEGEEKILELMSPFSIRMFVEGESVSPNGGSLYRQSLDMRTGLLSTQWEQTLDGSTCRIEFRNVVHPDRRVFSAHYEVRCQEPVDRFQFFVPVNEVQGKVNFDLLPGIGQEVTDNLLYLDGRPPLHTWNTERELEYRLPGREPLPARLFIAAGGDADAARRGPVGPGNSITGGVFDGATRFAAEITLELDRDGDFPAEFRPSMEEVTTGDPAGLSVLRYDSVAEASRVAAEQKWRTDIQIDGPEEDQQAIRSMLFYLHGSIHPEGQMSVSPLSLSGTTYFGHVFWDADIWVFPALALLDPLRAQAITDYRLNTLTGARLNFESWKAAGSPTGREPVSPLPPLVELAASLPEPAKYAWESSVTGLETVPGESRFQDHITGSIAWTLAKAERLGLADPERVRETGESAAAFWLNRVSAPEQRPGVYGTMSPDEFHTGDNDLYTNLLAQWTLDTYASDWRSALADGVPEADGLVLPRDEEGRLVTYDDDPIEAGYKQAAAVLAIYPLQFPEAEAQALEMLDRFEDLVTENGPAMTDSIHALIRARYGDADEALVTWRTSYQDFTNQPLLLFSEKPRREVTYFTTGAGGCLQAVLYGFAGLRIDETVPEEAAWSTPLPGGGFLSASPNLPSEWQGMTLRNLKVGDQSITLRIDGQNNVTEQ
jgi:trehalose/maltose hydrolase-like predicted phosphorylase